MKHALVIGGTAGIARPVIAGLEEAEYEITFTFNSNDRVAREIAESHPGSRAVQLNLTNLDAVDAFLEAEVCMSKPAHDALVICAGALQDGLSLGNIRERTEWLAKVNFIAPAMISAKVAERMAANRHGAIVNVTSVAARKPRVGNAIYGATKAAVERFSATLALEVARFKVRTLCIAPGFVDTDMFANFSKNKRNEILRSLPMRQILSPQEVADSILAFVEGRLATTGTTVVLGNGELVF